MRLGQYVKASGTYGTVVGVGGLGDGLVDVLLNGDDLVTEFFVSELVPIKVPQSPKIRSLHRYNINNIPTPLPLDVTKPRPPFIPVPAAGVFTREDLIQLDRDFEMARRSANQPNKKGPALRLRNTETIETTTRYHQGAGTSQIFGGRRE